VLVVVDNVANAGIIGGIIALALVLAKVVQHLVFSKGEHKDAAVHKQRTSDNGTDIASLRKDLEKLKECTENQEDMIRSLGTNMIHLQEQTKRSQEQLNGLIGAVSDLTATIRTWLAEEKGRREALRDRGDTGQFRIPPA
jgi:septal ring factor EnvC (AmiA/AmiB activator)